MKTSFFLSDEAFFERIAVAIADKNNEVWQKKLFSNDERISPSFGVGYFVPTFCFVNKSYVDIVNVYKVKSKSKRSSPNGGVIFLSLLS